MNDLAETVDNASAEPVAAATGFDLPGTELSPSLLAIEAELRGIRLETGKTEQLQREVYRDLAQKPPPTGPEEPR